MKKFIIWLANIFKVDITTEKVVIKEIIKEVEVIKEVPVIQEVVKEIIKEVPSQEQKELAYTSGDLTVDGNLLVNGYLKVDGEVTCYKINNI